MIQHVTEFSASSEETIHKIAEELAKSDRKFKVFEAVYSGGNKPKNAAALAALTGLTETVVLQLATPMAHQQYFETLKDKGRVSFKKYHHINAKKDKILRLAKDPTQRYAFGEEIRQGLAAPFHQVRAHFEVAVLDGVGQRLPQGHPHAEHFFFITQLHPA